MKDKSKVIEIIDAARSKLCGLASPLLPCFGIFKGPTQAAVFIFRRPPISILVFRSTPSLPDKQVEFRCDFPLSEALDRLPGLWGPKDQERIRRFFSSDETISLAELYERIMRDFFTSLSQRIVEQKTGFLLRMTGSHAVLVSFCRPGAIATDAVISDILNLDKREFPSRYYFAHTGEERIAYFGRLPLGVFIGEEPEKVFREEIEESWREADEFRIGEQFWKTSIAGIELIAFSAGAIAVDTSDRKKALDLINILLASLHLDDIRCAQLTDTELGEIHVDGHGRAWAWGIQAGVLREARYGLSQITEPSLKAAFRLASRVVEEQEIADVMKLAHFAWIHFVDEEFLEAFILHWTITERLLIRRWKRYVKRNIAEEGLCECLINKRDLTIHRVIENLNRVDEIDKTTNTVSQSMREARNKAIHEGASPSQTDTAECAKLASKLLRAEVDLLIDKIDTKTSPG